MQFLKPIVTPVPPHLCRNLSFITDPLKVLMNCKFISKSVHKSVHKILKNMANMVDMYTK